MVCFAPLSVFPAFSSCSTTLSHMEALKPLAIWGQQFCPTRGKWSGAVCQGEERRWLGLNSPSPSLRPGDSLPFQSRPIFFPPALPFGLALGDNPPGVDTPRIIGKSSRWRGSMFTFASTICKMPFSKISWEATKWIWNERNGHFLYIALEYVSFQLEPGVS